MSEADADAVAGREIWIEKYRPQRLSEIHGQEDIVDRLQSYIDRNDLPHLLLAGPAGVGKCVVGETPVLTDDGLAPIERVVGDVDGFAEPDGTVQLPSLTDDNEFEYTHPSHVFSKSASDLRRIQTRDGSDVLVTPEHKLLVVDDQGLAWTPAEQLDAGDRIARPETVPIPVHTDIDWIADMDEDRTNVSLDSEFAQQYDLPDRTVSLARLRELDVDPMGLRDSVTEIQYVGRFGSESRPITPVEEVTPKLAEFLGLAISEARIEGGRVKFYNTDQALLERFVDAVVDLFGLDPDRGAQKGVPYVSVRSRTLTHFLESTFDVFASASGEDPEAIGSAIVTADEASRTAFLRAMFDAEGYVSRSGVIELTQRNESHITLLSYLLASIGIPSRRKREMKKATNGTGIEREYHTLLVSGSPALGRFEDRVGFSIEHKAEALAKHADRESNPNHDTIPAQGAARELCDRLSLPVGQLLTDSLDPRTPGREAHLEDLDAVLDASASRIEAAQVVLERLDSIQPLVDAVTRVPATWVDARERLTPLETRRELQATVGVRSDRLLEYSDGRRSPTAARSTSLLSELDTIENPPPIREIQTTLQECIDELGVHYESVARGTELRGTDVIALLENDDHDLGSLTRFGPVTEQLRTLAADMLSRDVIERLSKLERVVESDLYFDEITAVDTVSEERRVYDLTVPGPRNYVAGRVPTVMHNTTAATAVAREIYGDDWRGNFLELNASDERGIDVVRDRIKSFARASFGGYDYRVIFLDEADSLTSDAQSALRRTMEQFSDNTRFILSCNYSSKIIDPIQSRCAVFRFSPLSDEAVAAQIEAIAEAEGIELTDDGREALVYAAAGDMRRAINSLQAAATTGEVVDEDAVYQITATARPEEIEAMVERAIEGDFTAARSTLDRLLTDTGMAGGDVIDQLHRSVWEFDLPERDTVRLMERIGEADYRIAEGANEQVQLEALLASLALDE